MNTREMQDRIMELKEQNDVCILAHAYQSHDIWDVADYVGDSYGLSVKAASAPQKTVIMAGVRFMAETVKMLSPDKKVILPNPMADCLMARQMDRDDVLEMKKQFPNAATVAYINTTSELKTAVDVVVTSSSAVKILKNMPEKEIIFIPDCNLGSWVQKQMPEKEFHFYEGGCATHMHITKTDVRIAREQHPDALMLVHPECREQISELADYVGSTTGIMDYARKSDAKEFIIGTENSIVQHLQFEMPEKKFYALSDQVFCRNMRITTLGDIYNAVRGVGGEEIQMSDELIAAAKKPIDKMIELNQ